MLINCLKIDQVLMNFFNDFEQLQLKVNSREVFATRVKSMHVIMNLFKKSNSVQSDVLVEHWLIINACRSTSDKHNGCDNISNISIKSSILALICNQIFSTF